MATINFYSVCERVRLLLELLAPPDPAGGQDLADQRALLPGPEVRRDARRGGGPAGEVADDRRPDGPQPQEAAPQGLGVGQGLDHARGGPGQVHPARRPAGDPPGDRRCEDRRAHRERRLLGRRRRRQRQEQARPDPHAGAGGVAAVGGRAHEPDHPARDARRPCGHPGGEPAGLRRGGRGPAGRCPAGRRLRPGCRWSPRRTAGSSATSCSATCRS